MQVNLNMFNVFETRSGYLIVHKFNVFETKIVDQIIQIFNVFETKVVVNGQLVNIYFIDININYLNKLMIILQYENRNIEKNKQITILNHLEQLLRP